MQQQGVFRTNCVDCLDRTNVVQTLFARAMLVTQLVNVGVLKEGEVIHISIVKTTILSALFVDSRTVSRLRNVL